MNDHQFLLPKSKLRVCALQLSLFANSVQDNLSKIKMHLSEIESGSVDLVVVPELANTFYNYEVIESLEEGEEEEFLSPLQSFCKEKNSVLVVGLAVREGGCLRNRAYFISSDGTVKGHYDKMHLISLLDEDLHFTPGNSTKIFDVKDWKVGIGICFDIRFPELFINYALDNCNLIVLPACFPYERRNHWRHLNLARAQEGQFFFLGANMGGTGSTKWGDKTYGGSILASPDSCPIAELPWGSEGILTCEIDPKEIAIQKSLFDLMANRNRPPL